MALYYFVDQYDSVYTGKKDNYYLSLFNSLVDTDEVSRVYHENPEGRYYLEPYLDCYYMMDEYARVSDKDLEKIKERVLYALDFYIKGKDFVGELPQE